MKYACLIKIFHIMPPPPPKKNPAYAPAYRRYFCDKIYKIQGCLSKLNHCSVYKAILLPFFQADNVLFYTLTIPHIVHKLTFYI